MTGKPLVLNLDVTARGPDDKARLDWIRKQFAKLDLQLVVRATDYNRFQDKIRKGNAQIFLWGWNADYPDPENFLFLLHGPQSRAKHEGENSANYANPEYDRLFDQMKNMENGPERQAIIDQMLEIARRDAPWVWGLHPKEYSLFQPWMFNQKPNQMARNGLKYQRIDLQLRKEKAGAMEPAGAVADGRRRRGVADCRGACVDFLPASRAACGGPCLATLSAASPTPSRS